MNFRMKLDFLNINANLEEDYISKKAYLSNENKDDILSGIEEKEGTQLKIELTIIILFNINLIKLIFNNKFILFNRLRFRSFRLQRKK